MVALLLAAATSTSGAFARSPELSQAGGTFDISSSSQIRFSVDQVGGGGISGRFTRFSGHFRIDGRQIGASSVTFTLYSQSVSAAELSHGELPALTRRL